MIAENKDAEQEEPKLTPEMMRSLLHILVTVVKGINVPQSTFDNYPEKAEVNMTFDEETKVWKFWVPRPRQRGIVVPKKQLRKPPKIIRPN